MMTVTVIKKTVYGNDLFYPACDNARIFAALVNRKTLSQADFQLIRSLGFTVTLQAETL